MREQGFTDGLIMQVRTMDIRDNAYHRDIINKGITKSNTEDININKGVIQACENEGMLKANRDGMGNILFNERTIHTLINNRIMDSNQACGISLENNSTITTFANAGATNGGGIVGDSTITNFTNKGTIHRKHNKALGINHSSAGTLSNSGFIKK